MVWWTYPERGRKEALLQKRRLATPWEGGWGCMGNFLWKFFVCLAFAAYILSIKACWPLGWLPNGQHKFVWFALRANRSSSALSVSIIPSCPGLSREQAGALPYLEWGGIERRCVKACEKEIKQKSSENHPNKMIFGTFGPSVEIRTQGLLNPIQARYQTSPHPVVSAASVPSPDDLHIIPQSKVNCKSFFEIFSTLYRFF